MRAVFPNERLMLKEHFRCVEPIIRFSMQFYPEKMLPLRIPAARSGSIRLWWTSISRTERERSAARSTRQKQT